MKDEVFVADYPLWIIVDRARYEKAGVPIGISKFVAQELGATLPVFTDDDLADRFLDDWQTPVVKMKLAIETQDLLYSILKELEKAGCQHVGVDISIFTGKLTGRFHPIREFIEDLSAGNA